MNGNAKAVARYALVGSEVEGAGARLRLGGVSFLNAKPVLHGLIESPPEGVSVALATPSELARRMIEDELDAALAPVALLAQHGALEVVPGIAIGCDGPVASVLLVGEHPIEDLDEVLLDASSRTSVVLARLILRARRGDRGEPRYVSRDPGRICGEVRGTTGALLIGDAALAARGRWPHELDLGAAWKELTGHAFVFAVWCARAGVLRDQDVAALRASLTAGLAARDQIAATHASEVIKVSDTSITRPTNHTGIPVDELGTKVIKVSDTLITLRAYLGEQVRYALDERALEGLREFLKRAGDAGLLPRCELRLRGEPNVRRPRSLDSILDDAAGGGRLSFEDAMRLGRDASTFDLGLAADRRRRALHPDEVVTYIVDRNVNYTNVCTTSCRFCAFYRRLGDAEAYVLSREQLAQKIRETVAAGGIQILLQGGLHPELGLEWYEDLFRWMKREFPIALHALSPEEIWHLARMESLPIESVLARLQAAGMDSLPGGGAEVLTDRVRRKIARAKCTSAEWLECMRAAHRLGMRSSATMMFGTVDTLEDRVAHLLKIRDLQDETGGFTAFICWDYQHEQGTHAPVGETGTVTYLRTQALARLVLDNVANVQSSWVTQGPAVGQIALRFGANDLGSTMFEENVVSSAGTTFAMDAAAIEAAARAAGFRVARRNMRYDRLGEPA